MKKRAIERQIAVLAIKLAQLEMKNLELRVGDKISLHITKLSPATEFEISLTTGDLLNAGAK